MSDILDLGEPDFIDDDAVYSFESNSTTPCLLIVGQEEIDKYNAYKAAAAVSLTEREAGEELADWRDWFENPAVRAAAEEVVFMELSLSGAAHAQAVCSWVHAYALGHAAALAGAASPTRKGSSEEAEVAGYHSTELSDISSIITWLHAQNKPMGELMRRFFNDARQGKVIKEYNDIDPLPQP